MRVVVEVVRPSVLGHNDSWSGLFQLVSAMAMDYDARDQVFSNRLVYKSGNFAQQLRVLLDSLSQSHLFRQAKDDVPVLDLRENFRKVRSAGLGLSGETRGTNPSLARAAKTGSRP